MHRERRSRLVRPIWQDLTKKTGGGGGIAADGNDVYHGPVYGAQEFSVIIYRYFHIKDACPNRHRHTYISNGLRKTDESKSARRERLKNVVVMDCERIAANTWNFCWTSLRNPDARRKKFIRNLMTNVFGKIESGSTLVSD